jgi:hypothetical protein
VEVGVVLVCTINGLIFLGLLWSLPVIWGLRGALQATAVAMTDWAEAAQGALHPAPAELLKLKQSLAESRQALTQLQQRLKFWRLFLQLLRWLVSRVPSVK